tara:strand:- start:126 stop:410 length:285 start_codon:yes stop_codon:yes gene_type:complete
LDILIIFFGIIIVIATCITHGIILISLFFTFLGFLGWNFGMRFLNENDNDDDFDGGKMITVFREVKYKFHYFLRYKFFQKIVVKYSNTLCRRKK